MIGYRTRRVISCLVLVTLASACSTSRLPPITALGAGFEPLRDETRLWNASRGEERTLRREVLLYRDPLLVDYLESIVDRLSPPGMQANRSVELTVSVVDDTSLNAFAFPHGALYVHTGLLARMQDEHQLATVLGHELTHVEGRHMLRHRRSARNKQLGFGIGAIAAAVILAGEEGDAYRAGRYGKAARIDVLGDVLIGLGLQLALIAAVNGYGRSLEREADVGGLDKMAHAGYDVRRAPDVYRALLDDVGEAGRAQAFFFGSHPKLTERVQGAETYVDGLDPDVGASAVAAPIDPLEFARRIRPVIRDDAAGLVEQGRLELAERQLARALQMMPEDARIHLTLGRLRLMQKRDEDAREALYEALRLTPELAAAHLELGLLDYRDDAWESACVAFGLYLELEPNTEEADRVRDYLLELERDGRCR